MRLSALDVERISRSIVDMLCRDERFMKRVGKLSAKSRMLTTRQAAELLGVSDWTVRKYAAELGGMKRGRSEKCGWAFAEEGLQERYRTLVGGG